MAEAHLGIASALFRLGKDEKAKKTLQICIQQEDAPAKDNPAHIKTIATCRVRLAQNYLLNNKPGTYLIINVIE